MRTKPPEIALIAAMGANRVIGKDNRLPWHLPKEWAYFMDTIKGHPIIMGRRCYESMGHALPDCPNIILSRSPDFHLKDADVLPDLPSALALAAQMIGQGTAKAEIMICGGEGIYRESLPIAHRLYLTEVALQPEGDTHFPEFPASDWRETSRRPSEDQGVRYDFVVYERASRT